MKIYTSLFIVLLMFLALQPKAQLKKGKNDVSRVWVADQGNGTYKNPVLHSDYSDPDAVRVGDDFYMTASSFDAVPGLPVLHSKDLVNWTIIGHALKLQVPIAHFKKTQHGNGVFAPAIRYHQGEFYIYYPDPDFGIYLTKSKNAAGPWSDPVLVEGGKGLIDPCPLWDTDGRVYLVHAWAKSRAGFNGILTVKELNSAGTKVLDKGVTVFEGGRKDPTVEGPKFYKRNGYYYIFAPAGGVATGWQLVLRSKNINGPYERRVVLHQGDTPINGPHQGAWVDTPSGENWFLHFQDKKAYGRVMHLQPMKWEENWPVIGINQDKEGRGEPVLSYRKPAIASNNTIHIPQESDEFNASKPGLQWQWQANPEDYWMKMKKGALRLYANQIPETAKNYWDIPHLLMQKLPAPEFMATTKLTVNFQNSVGMEAGLIMMGQNYAALKLKSRQDGIDLVYTICNDAVKGNTEKEKVLMKIPGNSAYFRIKVRNDAQCQFSYSTNGQDFTDIKEEFNARQGKWIGAKTGLFCSSETKTAKPGYAAFDWFRIEPLVE